MTTLPSTINPFAELEGLRDKLATRIRRREEIWQIINQGEVAAGIQTAEFEGIKLLNEQELSLRLLQEQRKALDDMAHLVQQKREQLEAAQTALATINIEEKKTAVNLALGMDYLQRAEVTLSELEIEDLNSLLVKLEELNIQDIALKNWKDELQTDRDWLNDLKNAQYDWSPSVTIFRWDDLHHCMESLVQKKIRLDDDQRQILKRLSVQHPNSRLLSRYKWLDTAYCIEASKSPRHIIDLQAPISQLVKMFQEKAPAAELERQLGSISAQIKNVTHDQVTPDIMHQLANIFLTPFTNIWLELIHDSKKIHETLGELNRHLTSIRSGRHIEIYVDRLAQLIENANDMAFHLHAQDCEDILGELGRMNSNYPDRDRYEFIQSLREKVEVKRSQGKQRFERVWHLDQ